MTITATLSQGNDSVDLPLKEEASQIVSAVDLGKPHLIQHDNGGSNFPRIQDQWSGNQSYNLIGTFIGPNAYQDAIALADLVLSDGGGNPMILDIPGLDEIESNVNVAPAAESASAVELEYQNGRKNVVNFDVGLTRINQVLGGYNRSITTPTTTGTGPIELKRGGTTIPLEVDVSVTRSVGRPNDVIKKSQSSLPNYFEKPKVVSDGFDISLFFTENAVTKTNQIANLFRSRLGRQGVTLDFNGLFGMGAFDVVPDGTQALRHVREAGKEGISIIPAINVNRIST